MGIRFLQGCLVLMIALLGSCSSSSDSSSDTDGDTNSDGDATDTTDGDEETSQPCNLPGELSIRPHIGGYNAVISWTAESGNEDTLEIRWQDDEGDQGRLVALSESQYVPLGLMPETDYDFSVRRRCGEVLSDKQVLQVNTGENLLHEMETAVPYTGPDDGTVILMNVFNYIPTMDPDFVIVTERTGKILWAYRTEDITLALADVDYFPERGTFFTSIQLIASEVDLAGNILYQFPSAYAHHDLDYLPGLGLAFLYFRILEDYEDFTPRLSDGIAITDPDTEELLWDWHTEDFIEADDYDEEDIQNMLLNLAYDWTHSNDLDYLPEHQVFSLNVRNLDRVLFVEYPSGNIVAQIGDKTGLCEGLWSHIHEIDWLEVNPDKLAGSFLMYNNGRDRAEGEDSYTSAIEVEFDLEEQRCEIVWEYVPEPKFYALGFGSVYRMDNGHHIMINGPNGTVFEIDETEQVIWEERYPGFWIYQAKPMPRSYFERGEPLPAAE